MFRPQMAAAHTGGLFLFSRFFMISSKKQYCNSRFSPIIYSDVKFSVGGEIMNKDKLFSWSTLLLVISCLCVNIAGARLVLFMGLPLFFDSAGTIIAAALGGYLPGIVVGFATNLIVSAGDSVTMYYGILSVLIAIAAAYMTQRRRAFAKLRPTLLAVLLFTFIGGALGSLLTWFLFGLNIGSGISAPLAIALNDNTSLGKFLSQFTADIFIDIFDKTLTTAAVCAAIHLLPRMWLAAMPFGFLFMRKSGKEGLGHSLVRTYRSFSLRTKIASLIIVSAAVLSVMSVTIGYRLYRNAMDQRYVAQCTAAVNLMGNAINGDTVRGFIETDGATIGYATAKRQLQNIMHSLPGIKYMYVYQIKEDGCHVVFDLDTPDTPGAKFGEVIEFDDEFREKYVDDLLAGREIPPVISNGQYGWLLTVYKPLMDCYGKCAAYAAADIAMDNVVSDRYVFIIQMLSLLFAASILLTAFVLWFAQRNIVAPLNSLASATNKFAYESEKERLRNTLDLRELNIKTGDEIEYLYSAISKTISDVFNYLRVIDEKNADVAEKASIISRMQDNIIVSFADMVENRDENTGSHIKRTAAYVRAISGEMNRRGRYKGALSDEYLTKLEKSAPLHDIGKIKIPDAILNKPGRLTPDEFGVIKTHTTSGKEILKNMFIGVKEDNYLSEALNMALNHHERWDGAGYPRGLRGADIPLGARIMAIADVFDALLSKRSYKEPFSFEDAVAIIKGESGTHFDPDVVEAFMNIKDELREIAESL